ncbi:MAG: glycosyltransferase family 39 protein [Phycisphaerae bacterium]
MNAPRESSIPNRQSSIPNRQSPIPNPQSAFRRPVREILIVVALTLLATSLRLWQLDAPSLWGDELGTIHNALSSDLFYSKMLGYLPTRIGLNVQGLGPDVLPADGYEVWRERGLDERAARLPSCLIGIVTIPLIYLATRQILPVPASTLASLFLCLSHWHILWSQTARFYSLQFLFYSLGLIFYYQATRNGYVRSWSLAVAMAVLAVLSQPTAAVIFLVFGADLLVRRITGEIPRFPKVPLIVGFALLAALCALLFRDVRSNPEQWLRFFQGPNQPPFRLFASTAFYVQPPMIAAALGSAWWLHRQRDRLGIFLLLAGVIPALAFSIVGLFAFVEARYCLISLYPWLLLASVGCMSIWKHMGRGGRQALSFIPILALASSQLVSLLGYYTEGGYRSRVREALEYVAARIQPDDQVCAHRLEGAYYLKRPIEIDSHDIRKVADTIDRRTWIVCGASNHGSPPRRWFQGRADLLATFDTYLVGPSESVQVYLIDPAIKGDSRDHAPP